MKCESIILLAVLAIFGLLVASSMATDEPVGEQKPETGVQPSVRANFVMPKFFDFEEFREKFNKHYANAAEVARRTKLFMARAFAVFISGIKYMYHKQTKFLKINPRSDWTQKEREASLNRGGFLSPVDTEQGDNETPVPAVDPEDVERVLAEIRKHKDEDADYAAIAAELEKANHNDGQHQQHQRKRRSADSSETSDRLVLQPKPTRHLSMEELSGDSLGPVVISPKYTPSVPSNNPDYEQLETFSQGADDEEDGQVKPMSEEEAKRIDQSKGNYLDFLVNSIKGAADNLFNVESKSGTRSWRTQYGSETDSDDDYYERGSPKKMDEVFVDYRDTGCFLQPKDQSQCGSCYIFATTALMEFHHCQQTGKLVPFSEQYAIDCGKNRNIDYMNGCNGGCEKHVGDFYARFGLELSADYPYRAREQTCPYEEGTKSTHMGHTRMEAPDIEMILSKFKLRPAYITQLLEEKGPLFISIYTGDDFNDFGGGVDILVCDPTKPSSHAMVIVGHGIEDGLEYFLIRNSYGIRFGIQGYYKLAKSSKEGCINRVGYVRGQFKRNRSHKGRTVFDELKKRNLLAQFA